MDNSSSLSLVLSCLFSVIIIIIWMLILQAFHINLFPRTKRKNNPPGPKPLPIIGNLLELGNKPHKSLAKLSQSYGPVMCLKFGRITSIVISSSALAKQVLQTHDQFFSHRTIPDAVRAHDHDRFGMAWIPVSTPRWRKLRRLCSHHLFSARTLDANQNLRQNKVRELLSDVEKSVQAGEAVDIGRAAFRTSLNLLSTTFFSVDFAGPSRSDIAREIKETVWRIMEEVGKPNVADYFPLLKWIDPQGIRRRTNVQTQKLVDLFDRVIDERLRVREVMKSGYTEDKDMLDTLINMTSDEDDREDHFDRTKIQHLLLDLFTAGTDTTSSTLEWSLAELLKAPEIMSKARAELEQVIGKGNQVMNESDITRLPYLQAIIKETLRLHPPTPLLLPRKAGADVEILGYTIPKGAQVLINVWAIGRDTSIWDNPKKFTPERFIESSIDVGGGHFELTPFGGGRRICPGLPLAMRMLHLMLGSLLHSFDWKLGDGVGPDDLNMEDKFGLTLQMAQPLLVIPMSTM